MGYHYHIAMKNFISTIIIGVYAAGLFIAAQLGYKLVFFDKWQKNQQKNSNVRWRLLPASKQFMILINKKYIN